MTRFILIKVTGKAKLAANTLKTGSKGSFTVKKFSP